MRTRLATLVLILGLATSASADCAWILWLEAQEGWDAAAQDRLTWARLGVYTTQAACLAEARTRISNLKLDHMGWSDAENGKAMWNKDTYFYFWHYQCWPDTVNLREERKSGTSLSWWLGWAFSWFH
jgi:hypothetical protein